MNTECKFCGMDQEMTGGAYRNAPIQNAPSIKQHVRLQLPRWGNKILNFLSRMVAGVAFIGIGLGALWCLFSGITLLGSCLYQLIFNETMDNAVMHSTFLRHDHDVVYLNEWLFGALMLGSPVVSYFIGKAVYRLGDSLLARSGMSSK